MDSITKPRVLERLVRRLRAWQIRGRKGTVLGGFQVAPGRRSVFPGDAVLDARAAPILLGDDVLIGSGITVLTGDPAFPEQAAPVAIGNAACLGPESVILPGTTIGQGAVIAARSVVVGPVAPWSIVAGAPARPIGKRHRDTRALEFLPANVRRAGTARS